DYVVMQCDDNSYYLDHNYKGEYSQSGAIFADYHVPITAESEPANIILYGHNMSSGEYFAKLTRYFNYRNVNNYGMEYVRDYPTLTFSTLYEQRTYKIFAGMLVNTRESEGEVFNYIAKRNFENKADFDEYCAKILDRSTFLNPDINLKYGDKLLTLSTCIFDYGKNLQLRWVVFARAVRDGENPEVDTSKAYPNPDPLYFDYYYSLNGGSWGGRKWPAEMIQGFVY
ncbi:MAG: class B sortase, partial [Oscillospiraceae bacterium]